MNDSFPLWVPQIMTFLSLQHHTKAMRKSHIVSHTWKHIFYSDYLLSPKFLSMPKEITCIDIQERTVKKSDFLTACQT